MIEALRKNRALVAANVSFQARPPVACCAGGAVLRLGLRACMLLLACARLSFAQNLNEWGPLVPPSDARASRWLESAVSAGVNSVSTGFYAGFARVAEPSVAGQLAWQNQGMFAWAGNWGFSQRQTLSWFLPTALNSAGPSAETHISALDPVISLKGNLLEPGIWGGVGAAISESVSIPAGDAASLLSERTLTSHTKLLLELKLGVLDVRGSLGAWLRPQSELRRAGIAARYGSELRSGLGVIFYPKILGWDNEGRSQVAFEAAWGNGLASRDQALAVPLLFAGSFRYNMHTCSILASVQWGTRRQLGAPSLGGLLSLVWTPKSGDNDADGIENKLDLCPDLAEDRDGIEDDDGCPEFE